VAREPELRKQWFAGGTTPQAGGEIELIFDHDNRPGGVVREFLGAASVVGGGGGGPAR